MIDETHLIALIDAYAAATRLPDTTISSRVFDDSKRIAVLRQVGKSLTVRKFNDAVEWFSANWPDEASWPAGIERPAIQREAAQ